jgi:DNA-binding XRE family transcriptional regulator
MDKSLRPVRNLRELRARRGLTQEELAVLSRVPRRTIARHEAHPEIRLRRDARVALAKALKVKLHDLDREED